MPSEDSSVTPEHSDGPEDPSLGVDYQLLALLSVGIGSLWIVASVVVEPVYVDNVRVFTALVAALGGLTVGCAPAFILEVVHRGE